MILQGRLRSNLAKLKKIKKGIYLGYNTTDKVKEMNYFMDEGD